MDWFQYDNGFRHERANLSLYEIPASKAPSQNLLVQSQQRKHQNIVKSV